MNERFEELCEIEPLLKRLYHKVRQVKDTGEGAFCANAIWYRQFKPELIHLVGYHARHPALRTTEAYDVSYQFLYNQLPDCRDCGCF
jgi:hypothetical protein